MDLIKVNVQVIDVINQVQFVIMSLQVVFISGVGKVYQLVVQLVVIVVQDVVDVLCNVFIIVIMVAGVVMVQYLVIGEDKYVKVLIQVQLLMQGVIDDFVCVGIVVVIVFKDFLVG